MKFYFILVIILFLLGCASNAKQTSTKTIVEAADSERKLAKYEPEDGRCILFVGQELEAIGGLGAPFNDGYMDHFSHPGGFTMYTGLNPGAVSFGHTMEGLDGIWQTDNWGDGSSNISMQLEDEDFDGMGLAIGLSMAGGFEKMIYKGAVDSLIVKMGSWFLDMSPRPIFLRIGYEFSGPWNGYNRESYIKSYRYIKDMLDDMKVDNVAYVWQSHGYDEPIELLEAWYPGDEYVDWCSYSFFARWNESNMIRFARDRGKPVFIAEATPTLRTSITQKTGLTKETILSNPLQASAAWAEWFVPFFKTIDENPDVVKAVSYINCHWRSHQMWYNNPTFKNVDARLQINDQIIERWNSALDERDFIMKGDPFLKRITQQ